MTWTYEYNADADETTIQWTNGSESKQATVSGQITRWENGYPATEAAREAVSEIIQSAGTPERIRMMFDLNYGFTDQDDTE